MKSELKRQCAQDPVAMAYEIDRLNAQVAMLRETLRYSGGVTQKRIDDVVKSSESEWLATHDAKVRDDVLSLLCKHGVLLPNGSISEIIRMMK